MCVYDEFYNGVEKGGFSVGSNIPTELDRWYFGEYAGQSSGTELWSFNAGVSKLNVGKIYSSKGVGIYVNWTAINTYSTSVPYLGIWSNEITKPINNYPNISAVKIYYAGTDTEYNLDAVGVPPYPFRLNVTLSDIEGDSMNISIYHYKTPLLQDLLNSSNSLSNGTYSFYNFSFAYEPCVTYYLWINLTDGYGWVNNSYNFDMICSFNESEPTGNTYRLVSICANETIHKTNSFLLFKNSTLSYNWNDAVANGIIYNYIYNYSYSSDSYYITEYFKGYEGFWINFVNESYGYSMFYNESGSMDCNASGDFLYIAGLELEPPMIVLFVWGLIFYLANKHEDAMLFLLAGVIMIVLSVYYIAQFSLIDVVVSVGMIGIGFYSLALGFRYAYNIRKK
jgi:hypothetical protein